MGSVTLDDLLDAIHGYNCPLDKHGPPKQKMCKRGLHPLIGENLGFRRRKSNSRGEHYCVRCHNDRQKTYRKRKRRQRYENLFLRDARSLGYCGA